MNEIALDRVDLDILKMLQQDALATTKEIAITLKKGNNTISRKIERFRQLGLIKGSVTLIDHSKIAELLIVFTHLHLNDHSSRAMGTFLASVTAFEEVQECFQTTGNFDFLLKIVIPSMSAYQDFLSTKLAVLDHVGEVHSHFVIKEAKRNLYYPIIKGRAE